MIRRFTTADLDSVMKLWVETNVKAHFFIEESYWYGHFETVREMMPGSTLFVYEEDGEIKGFVGLMDHHIAGIFIDADNQSKGIGKQLLDYIKKSRDELSLNVYQKNVRAIQFYLREGFVISNQKIDEDTGEIELVMKWKK